MDLLLIYKSLISIGCLPFVRIEVAILRYPRVLVGLTLESAKSFPLSLYAFILLCMD